MGTPAPYPRYSPLYGQHPPPRKRKLVEIDPRTLTASDLLDLFPRLRSELAESDKGRALIQIPAAVYVNGNSDRFMFTLLAVTEDDGQVVFEVVEIIVRPDREVLSELTVDHGHGLLDNAIRSANAHNAMIATRFSRLTDTGAPHGRFTGEWLIERLGQGQQNHQGQSSGFHDGP